MHLEKPQQVGTQHTLFRGLDSGADHHSTEDLRSGVETRVETTSLTICSSWSCPDNIPTQISTPSSHLWIQDVVTPTKNISREGEGRRQNKFSVTWHHHHKQYPYHLDNCGTTILQLLLKSRYSVETRHLPATSRFTVLPVPSC